MTRPTAQAAHPTRAEWAVAGVTLAYVLGFTAWFFAIGNFEFIVYVITMAGLIALVGLNLARAAFPPVMLWALSLWGLLHMAGGGVPVGDSVLYSMPLLPVIETERYMILKYDQAVHAYGFGVTAWLLWHLMTRHFPATRGSVTALVYPLFGAMGLGALNEMIEFTAVLLVPETNVGGYYNTALDLVFNALGAGAAVALIGFGRR